MIEIQFQNEDFVVTVKPQGVSFHSETGEPGLFEQVKTQLNTGELYPVHRLDKLTSGLVIFAKHQSAAAEFGGLFEQHQVDKYYVAISDQKPKKKQGWIKGDMAKARRGAFKLLRTMDNPAKTRFISTSVTPGTRLYLLKPYSGKTHQLRVALKSVGAPIIGDELYGGEPADRAYLHAYALRFTLSGEYFEFRCPPCSGEQFIQPTLSAHLLNTWHNPWDLF